MKNPGSWYYGPTLWACILSATTILTFESIAVAQEKVAPPSAGYGNRAGQGSPSQPNGTAQQNGAARQSQEQRNTPANANLNPNLNQAPLDGAIVGGPGSPVVVKDPFANNPLTPQELQHLDQVLSFWEKSTADITRFASKFRRWQYNSNDNFVAQLAQQLGMDVRNVHTTVAAGEVKYSAPDQGMFKIEKLLSMTGQAVGKLPEYKEFPNRFGEWWVCDGKYVYEYDRNEKRCTKHELPPDMKGSAILDSPMPFVFGVNAEKMKARYWMRMKPSPNNDLFVIEVHPKFQADAVNYDHVEVYLDRQQFLPTMVVKYNTEHVDEPDQVFVDNREVFEFTDREKNSSLLQRINETVWRKEFLPVDIPNDWKMVEVPYAPPGVGDLRSATVPAQSQGGTGQPNTPPRR